MSGASITEHAAGSRQGPAGRLLQPILDADLLGRYGLGIALLAGAYYAGAHLGYAFEFSGPVAAIVGSRSASASPSSTCVDCASGPAW